MICLLLLLLYSDISIIMYFISIFIVATREDGDYFSYGFDSKLFQKCTETYK